MVETTLCKPACTLSRMGESEGGAESEQFPSGKGVTIRLEGSDRPLR
jgi:hypothetical protein